MAVVVYIGRIELTKIFHVISVIKAVSGIGGIIVVIVVVVVVVTVDFPFEIFPFEFRIDLVGGPFPLWLV
jgi:hypothetical protein